jgi:hypothetical protein
VNAWITSVLILLSAADEKYGARRASESESECDGSRRTGARPCEAPIRRLVATEEWDPITRRCAAPAFEIDQELRNADSDAYELANRVADAPERLPASRDEYIAKEPARRVRP